MADEVQDLPDTPAGRASLWALEFAAARKDQEKWHEQGDKIVRRYLDDREANENDQSRVNLFTADTQTKEAHFYGQRPKTSVERRFGDSEDAVARVAGEMLERILNTDIEKDSDTAEEAFRNSLRDWLLPGLGGARLRYVVEWEEKPEVPAMVGPDGLEQAPAVPAQKVKASEEVDTDYFYWKDHLWSPCRTYSEMRWRAFKAPMSRDQLIARFGEVIAKALPMNTKDEKVRDPLSRCDVWECWDKDKRRVEWYVEGYPQTLDKQEDPLGLAGFWPAAEPLIANPTTSRYLPTPDFVLAQDLYDKVDELKTRIDLLSDAIRVVGVYDQNSDEIKGMLSHGGNKMIPVSNWAMFAEKKGISGAVDWFPIDMVVAARHALLEQLPVEMDLLRQVTGMSDILRGQASAPATATEQAIKARYAGVRIQTSQNEFARFCGDTQRIKAEIISKHFDPQTIIERSNIMRTPDAQYAQQAVELIKSKFYEYRISVDPDAVNLTDFAALKQERFEFLQGVSGYFQSMMPVVQALVSVPGAVGPVIEFVLDLGRTATAAMKGSSEMGGIFDKFAAKMKALASQPPPPPQPDPQLQVAQVKAQAEETKAKASMAQTGMDMQVAQAQHGMDMQKMQAEERQIALKAIAAQQAPEAAG